MAVRAVSLALGPQGPDDRARGGFRPCWAWLGVGVRYDACVIGSGADGLTAAAWLARAGLATRVIERESVPGGRLAFREFHPGFRAPAFVDEPAPVPDALFHAFDLARAGAILVPAPTSLAVWPGRAHFMRRGETAFLAKMQLRVAALRARAEAEAARVPPRWTLLGKREPTPPWPSGDLCTESLDGVLRRHASGDEAAHLLAQALCGRTADPFLAGSALHLAVPSGGGVAMSGRLPQALAGIARDAGAEISCGLEAIEVARVKGRIAGVTMADGSVIEARAVISTLDLKRTLLSLFRWNELSGDLAQQVNQFRFAGGTARLLVALEHLPGCQRDALRGPIHLAPSAEGFAEANAAWRAGTIPPHPPATIRVVSASDPGLAPRGAASVAVTLSGIALRPFDGAWTHDKREALRTAALAALDAVFPGAKVLASEVIAPPDFEESLGLTGGDLWGGEIAPDQMFAARMGPRTPIAGLYLGGPSSAAGVLGACFGGFVAARALLADREAGRP